MTTITDIIVLLRGGDYLDLAALNADRRTHGPISLQALGTVMHRIGLGRVLTAVAADEQVPAEVRGTIADWQAYVADPRQQWLGADDHEVADRLAGLIAMLISAEHITSGHALQIYALGGGLRVPEPISQSDYDAALARIEREDAAGAALAEYDTAANAARNSYAHALDQWIENGGVMPNAGGPQ